MERKQVHTAYGVITALLMIVINVVMLLTGNQDNKAINWIAFLPFLGGIIACCVAYSKANNKLVTFGQVFSSGFKASALIAIIIIIWSFLSLYIWPDIQTRAIEKASLDMESKHMDQAQIDQAIGITRKYFKVFMAAGALFSTLFFGAIFSLIGAAVAPKKGVPHNPQVTQKF